MSVNSTTEAAAVQFLRQALIANDRNIGADQPHVRIRPDQRVNAPGCFS